MHKLAYNPPGKPLQGKTKCSLAEAVSTLNYRACVRCGCGGLPRMQMLHPSASNYAHPSTMPVT